MKKIISMMIMLLLVSACGLFGGNETKLYEPLTNLKENTLYYVEYLEKDINEFFSSSKNGKEESEEDLKGLDEAKKKAVLEYNEGIKSLKNKLLIFRVIREKDEVVKVEYVLQKDKDISKAKFISVKAIELKSVNKVDFNVDINDNCLVTVSLIQKKEDHNLYIFNGVNGIAVSLKEFK